MTVARWTTICDQCGKHSQKYDVWPDCLECGDDICPDHVAPGTLDEETSKCICTHCWEEGARAEVAA